MNPSALIAKIAYLAAFVALLFPMAWLGAPSTLGDPARTIRAASSPRLRSDAKLGQADLGAIDPASETIRLATLGLRGMAVTMLWNKANEYKKTEDWTAFQATLEQLARLQPYFVKVWQYQAWNLSYNVSVELDDVRDRFYYVKQGIEYLEGGHPVPARQPDAARRPRLVLRQQGGPRRRARDVSPSCSSRTTTCTPPTSPPANRDNWLVSKEWYEAGDQRDRRQASSRWGRRTR